jgi:hypothetical protein
VKSELCSYAPPGLMIVWLASTHGSRRGLRSYAPPGLGYVLHQATEWRKVLAQGVRDCVKSQSRVQAISRLADGG